jgi:peptidoglycan/xylan/chitin deacetylase (PgdA/CDA1 family)
VSSLSPSELAARRAAARRRRRRRRAVGTGALIALVAAIVVAVIEVGRGGGAAAPRKAPVTPEAVQPTPVRTDIPPRLVATMAAGRSEIARLARYGLPLWCGGSRGNEVAFTFDDGPGVYTHFAVKKLTQSGERATFFAVGKSMDAWPRWLPKELRVGAIGDHTYHHLLLPELPPNEIRSEIATTKEKIERASGQPVDLFRPPYGGYDATVSGIVKSLGLLDVMWTQDSRDSLGADWSGIIQNVEVALHPGAIILMHENRGQTIRALTTLLPELKRRHLRSVTIPELLATDPPTLAQLRRGPAGCGIKGVTTTGS